MDGALSWSVTIKVSRRWGSRAGVSAAKPPPGAWFWSPLWVRVYGPDVVRRRGLAVYKGIVAPEQRSV